MKPLTKAIRHSSVSKAFKDKKKEPIPYIAPKEKELLNKLISYVEYLEKELKNIPSYGSSLAKYCDYKLAKRYFGQIIEALIIELYFPEELHKYDKYFMSLMLEVGLPLLKDMEDPPMEELKVLALKLFDKNHPIRVNIFFLNSVPIVGLILNRI